MIVQPRLASAVMLLQDRPSGGGIEVFMVRRVIQSDFMPDVYVFPGGSVSKDDNAAELTAGICAPVAESMADPEGRTVLGSGMRAAAIRELFEEAGILLAYRDGNILPIPEERVAHFDTYRHAFQQRAGSLVEMARAEGLVLATDMLGYFAHWITPEGMPKRFDTHFFITIAPSEQQTAHDRLETSEGIWIEPSVALAGYERGTFPLVFATIYQLRELSAFDSVQDALNHTVTQHVPTRIPILEMEGDTARVHLAEDAGDRWDVPEHMRRSKASEEDIMQQPYTIILAPNPSIMTGPGTNSIILGGGTEGAIVIDPADDHKEHQDALVRAGEERGGIRRILVTHGHPDHMGGAEALRERLHVPIFAYNRQGVPIADEELADGAALPLGDDTLRAIHTPGHRFDHLCFYLERQRILFAGDLISGITTNVIAPPDGDMFDYMNSLQRLQELDIAEIVPGHGPNIADAQAKITEYIAHRRLREQQILDVLETLPRGVTIPEIVPVIYTDVDPALYPIAAWTVEAHLLKLEKEGLVERIGEKGWALADPTA